MKIKALSRSTSSYQTPGSHVPQAPRNLEPAAHPFERAREYTRALNATKLERMFAAPFVAQLGRGHVDGVYTLAKDPEALDRFASGSGDGVVKVWDLPSREEVWQGRVHDGMVRSLCWTQDRRLLSCGSDKMVKLHDPYTSSSAASNRDTAPATWLGPNAFTSLTPHRHLPSFAASSSSPTISIYDLSRPSSTPSQTLSWPTSVDSINAVAFNQVQSNILASAASDRGLVFYDLVSGKALHRTVLGMAGNAISWNPMEAFNVAVACEDHNIYIFDMRQFGSTSHAGGEKRPRALNILKGHVSAVMDVEFSPTGEELVSASYDRSIRLWRRNEGHARDVYHTKRMQRVFSARFTPDNNYIISGSDDGNVRLWRANASARSGIKTARQRQNLEYAGALKERYKHLPEIRRISRHRHVPKQIMKAGEIKAEELKSIKRKEENERKNSRKGLKQRRSEREKMVLATEQ